jgi:DNA repair photolyase
MKEKKEKVHYYSSPRWSGEILDCSMPLTFDQYDHCSYNCLYCFSYYQKALKAVNPLFPSQMGKAYQSMEARPVRVEKIKRLFTGKLKSQFNDYIADKITMQWGGLSDPFDEFEKKQRVGLELLQFFKEINYPLCLSTKGTWWVWDDDYVDAFDGQTNWNTKFSIISLDKKKSKLVELGVPSPEDRLDALEEVADWDAGGVTLRLRPFVIGMSDETYLDLIKEAGERGAQALSMEFFCLETRGGEGIRERYARMSEAIGLDIVDFYKRNSPGMAGYLRLNWKIKQKYVEKAKKLCDKLGMRFYISDAHWKDQCANGSCCGLTNDWNYARGQFTEILIKAKNRKDGKVYWSDMEPHVQMYKKFQWRKAEGFNTSGTRVRCQRWQQTMYDYIKEIWNSPNNAKSPYKYFAGLLRPIGLDSEENVVYQYQPYKGGKS